MKLRRSPQGFTLIELLVVISIIAILAGIAVPTFTTVITKGNQTKDLSNAKQVYLGLRAYSSDNDGVFPSTSGTITINTGNDAFKLLIPQYIPTESIFYLAKSRWTPQPPDNNISSDAEKLKQGENNYAYVTGLFDTSNPSFPIIADGFSDGGAATGTYSNIETDKGGVWKGTAAIVVRVDGSGKVEKVDPGSHQVLGQTGQSTQTNIFVQNNSDPNNPWLSGTNTKPVNPL